ncbi:MAG: hypothetical protein U0441_05775 [Polyangiaceae bacterium]
MKLREGVEGMISTSDVLEPEGGKIKAGDKVKCEVSSIDTIDRRLFLAMKNVGAEALPRTLLARRRRAEAAPRLAALTMTTVRWPARSATSSARSSVGNWI